MTQVDEEVPPYDPTQADDEDVPAYDLTAQSREIAERMAARGFVSPLGGVGPQTPEETAEAFGRGMFKLHGKDCHRLIGIATGAAMRAEREALGA